MAAFPFVDSPCPHEGPLSEILDGDHCRLCDKQVHDLTPMTGSERRALLAEAPGELCVRYVFSAKMAVTTMLGAGAMASPAFAQAAAPDQSQAVSSQTKAAVEQAVPEDQWIIVGGIRDPKAAHWVKTKRARKGREMPVIEQSPEAKAPDAKS